METTSTEGKHRHRRRATDSSDQTSQFRLLVRLQYKIELGCGPGLFASGRKSLKTTNKKEALKRAYAFAHDFAGGHIDSRRNRITVGEAMDQKLARVRELNRDKYTIEAYARFYFMLETFLPRGRKTLLTQLTLSTMEAFERHLRTHGCQYPPNARGVTRPPKPLGPTSIHSIMGKRLKD